MLQPPWFHVAKKHLLVFIAYSISQVTRPWSLIERQHHTAQCINPQVTRNQDINCQENFYGYQGRLMHMIKVINSEQDNKDDPMLYFPCSANSCWSCQSSKYWSCSPKNCSPSIFDHQTSSHKHLEQSCITNKRIIRTVHQSWKNELKSL